MPIQTESLLDPAFLKKLDRLSLTTRRAFAGQMKGEKRSTKRGASVEFADYREYALGDDLRYVDWNTAARLGKMFVKLFVEEEDLYLALLLDSSRSMDFGDPKKLRFAARCAAAFAYMALTNFDRVTVQPYAASLSAPLPVQRGKSGIVPCFRYLERISAVNATDMSATLRKFAASCRSKGLAIVISDLFDAHWQEGLKSLLARGFQVCVVHVLADDELSPQLRGDLRIIDSETGESREMSVSPQLLTRYLDTLAGFCTDVEQFCHRYGIDYFKTAASSPVEDFVLHQVRRAGLIK